MSTLADTFLDDLDDLSEDEDGGLEDQAQNVADPTNGDTADLVDLDDLDDGAADDLESVLKVNNGASLSDVAGLRQSERFHAHMARMEAEDNSPCAVSGPMEYSPVYQLIVESNAMLQEIDEEMVRVHRFTADAYSTKFPELESMVPNPLDYANVAKQIGNEMDMTQVDLSGVLPSAQVMVVTVTGSTTSGQPLTSTALRSVFDGADEMVALDDSRQRVMQFIEGRMAAIAPNFSELLGSNIAAQMLCAAGGLDALARMPSCNVQTLGAGRKQLSGFSTTAAMPHAGLIYFSQLVQSAPPSLRMKACRVTAGRVTLAARLDLARGAPGGESGRKWHAEITSKIEKLQEPQQGKTKKALPVPGAQPRRKRGGKRYRAMKDKYEITDVRKEAGRLMFEAGVGGKGSSEYSESAMGIDFGTLGKHGSGRVRISKKEKKQAAKKQRRIQASSGATSGLSSSLAFTPVQGLELMNPEQSAARIRAANSKYFGSSEGFKSTIKETQAAR